MTRHGIARRLRLRHVALFIAGVLFAGLWTASAAEDQIELGMSSSLTGPVSSPNTDALHGLQSYLNMVNEHGGVNGKKLHLTALDDGYQPQKALSNVKELVENNRVSILLGSIATATTVATLPYVTENGTPLLFPYAGSSAVYDPPRKNVYSVVPDYGRQLHVLLPYVVDKVKPKKVAMIWLEIEGIRQAATFAEGYLHDKKVAVTTKIPYQIGSITDFTPIVQQVKAENPDAILLLTSTPDGARFAQAVKRAGWSVPIVGMSTFSDALLTKLAGADADGIYGIIGQRITTDKAATATVEMVLKKYYPGDSISAYTMYGYGQGELLVETLKRSRSTAPADITRIMDAMKNVKTTIFPPVTFTAAKHLGTDTLSVTQVRDGRIVRLSEF